MAYKIRTRRNKTHSSVPTVRTILSRHSIVNNQLNNRIKNKTSQTGGTLNFNLQNVPISRAIDSKKQKAIANNLSSLLVQAKTFQKGKTNKVSFRKLYYKYRNGKQGKSLDRVRMTLIKYAIRKYKIDTYNAELKYIPDTEKNKNAAANYSLKNDYTIDKTCIKFYPQLFQLPLNSFINTIRHEAYHVFLYNKGIYDVDSERRCHKHIHEFLAEAKEILGRNQENPQQFYYDASRALRHWILIYKNPPLPDFKDIDEAKLMEFMQKQYDRVQKQIKKRYTDFIEEYGTDNQLAKKLNYLLQKYEQHRP